jgi:hypothetical protein
MTTHGGRGIALRAGLVAGALAGAPSTLHALAAGRDPLEATLAAGSVLLPGESRRERLVAAAVPVHLAISLGWAVVFDRAGIRGSGRGALAGLAIAALDLGLARRLFPRFRELPVGPQVADHVTYGAIVGSLISRRESG